MFAILIGGVIVAFLLIAGVLYAAVRAGAESDKMMEETLKQYKEMK